MKRFFLIPLSVFAVCINVSATDYYIAPNGDDNNNGSLEAPFLSIRKGIESAKPGSTIYLREGTYKPQNSDIMRENAEGVYSCVYDLSIAGKAGSPITISGYPGEKVVIDLSEVRPDERVMGFYVKSDYWHLKDFDNTFFSEISLKDSDFESLDASQLLKPRKADGSLPDITFMKLKPSSPAYAKKIGYQFHAEDSSDVSEITLDTNG